MQQTCRKGVQDLARLCGEGDPLEIVPESEIWRYKQMVKYKPESVQENKTSKILWDFEIQTDHLIPAGQLDLVIIHKKREAIE